MPVAPGEVATAISAADKAADGAAIRAVPGLSAQGYVPHALHGPEQVWVEKNCYSDVWIELLHALGLEPRAMLPFTLALDFEGDHWTFHKPSHDDLQLLYGLEVRELNVWRPLLAHALEHLARGRLIATEADAYWLPDTAGTDYGRQHVKTTIVLNHIDTVHERVGYFHNAGYFEASGEDYRQLFKVDGRAGAGELPLYAELVRTDRRVARTPDDLRHLSMGLLRKHLAQAPADNPVHRFAERLNADWPQQRDAGDAHYHAWAFSTVRQLGSAFELAGAYLAWLAPEDEQLAQAATHFQQIAGDAKALILKLARLARGKRDLDALTLLAPIAEAWQAGMSQLSQALDA